MIKYFRKLSLSKKLLLIGFIPMVLLLYFISTIINEKNQKLAILEVYLNQVEISKLVSDLNESLGLERRYSYEYLLTKKNYANIPAQRRSTDSLIKVMKSRPELALKDFTEYTFLDQLGQMRKNVDSISSFDPNVITDYYTRCIFRSNYIGGGIPQSDIYLKGTYKKLVSQHIITQMITFLSILRNNIFNALYTRKYMVETLMGSYGIYTVYNTYITEFDIKAERADKKKLDAYLNTPGYKEMSNYMDTVFSHFSFDSSLNAQQWWALSNKALSGLKQQQESLWQDVKEELTTVYKREKRNVQISEALMAVAIVLVLIFIVFTISSIRVQLKELSQAAKTISRGETQVQLSTIPSGMMGVLASSILEIEKNYLVLAQAAGEIGKGNFDVKINPRNDQDTLALSLKKMKQDLRKFNAEKDLLQKQTMELVHQRDELFSMASHELKTPVTTIKAFAYLLKMDFKQMSEEQQTEILSKLEKQTDKLRTLIEDLMDISRIQYNQLVYNKKPVNVGKIIADIVNEIQIANPERRIILQKNLEVELNADPIRLGQVMANLLSNAIKYTPFDKEIIVSMEKDGEKVVGLVHDFGSGIPKEKQEKVFDRFYRIPGEKLQTYPGLGMGLFISRQIIENHGGRMWVESEDGKYCKFYFELPLKEKLN